MSNPCPIEEQDHVERLSCRAVEGKATHIQHNGRFPMKNLSLVLHSLFASLVHR